MKLTRKSSFTGIERSLEIDVAEEQMVLWQSGVVIQTAMPNLTSDEREFILTGITAEEWNDEFGSDE